MEGVILFADDHIFEAGRIENALFQKFNNESSYSVLPINNLITLEKTVVSISTYKALILDWNFKRTTDEDDIEGLQIPDDDPHEFLRSQRLYSLVYVYSQEDIGQEIQAELQQLYPNKIFFNKKGDIGESDKEYAKILKGIQDFENDNRHLNVPFVWSQSINKSAQKIFSELESSDKFWIKELYYSSVRKFDKQTGVPTSVEFEPSIEVINLFQNILSERLIQDKILREAIKTYSVENFKETPTTSSITGLYSKLYYTQTLDTDSVMTGDIYKLAEDCFGVIISPECDMMKLISKNEFIELLCFTSKSFDTINSFCKTEDEIKRAYNQEISAVHLLPIFPFDDDTRSTALIDFRFSLKLVKAKYLHENVQNRKIKINSPYIQQLRQRYLSYVGRVGVPAIPQSLRLYNLKSKPLTIIVMIAG